MKLKLEITESENQDICRAYAKHDGYHYASVKSMVAKTLEILTAKLPEIPEPARWIPRKERRPTRADGIKPPHWNAEVLLWILSDGRIFIGDWDNPPYGPGEVAVAFLPIPAYAPPVPTPEEISRKEFEEFIHSYGRPLEPGEINWAKAGWQAARAKGGAAS